jgi:hypothetical protein
MNSSEQLQQFVHLWSLIQNVSLSADADAISWSITANGKYSAASAYGVQFLGRLLQNDLQFVWRVRAEGKVQFFLWLLLQNRNWTAERLRARGLPHEHRCSLCDQEFETAAHLALNCSYVKEVWDAFLDSNPAAVRMASSSTAVTSWWAKIRQGKWSEQRQLDTTTSVYIVWHAWKEREAGSIC